MLLRRRSGLSRTNYDQFIPYMSKDVSDHHAVYQAVKTILRDVFDWVSEKVRLSHIGSATFDYMTGLSTAQGSSSTRVREARCHCLSAARL